ncbi:MAG: hypothetical protein ABIL70_08050 [candidate division WOR-3 bacterium]
MLPVNNITFHPAHCDTVFTLVGAGSYSDALYRSIDTGITWQFVDWFVCPYSMTICAFPYIILLGCIDDYGIYKSEQEDFGETWEHIGRTDNMPYSQITCVAIVEENIIYAGYYDEKEKSCGIQMTTNGGRDWRKLPIILDDDLIDILVDSGEPKKFYLAIKSSPGIKFFEYNISNLNKLENKKVVIKR